MVIPRIIVFIFFVFFDIDNFLLQKIIIRDGSILNKKNNIEFSLIVIIKVIVIAIIDTRIASFILYLSPMYIIGKLVQKLNITNIGYKSDNKGSREHIIPLIRTWCHWLLDIFDLLFDFIG